MAGERKPGGVERILKVFTEVHPGEAGTALLLTANVFLLLCAYSLLKVLREPLILAGGGAEVKSYSAAGQAILLLIAVPLYAALANRYPRRQLINVVTALLPHLPCPLLRLGAAQRPRGRCLLHLARHLQRDARRPVLVVCQRPLHQRRRKEALPDRRLWSVVRRGCRRLPRRTRHRLDRALSHLSALGGDLGVGHRDHEPRRCEGTQAHRGRAVRHGVDGDASGVDARSAARVGRVPDRGSRGRDAEVGGDGRGGNADAARLRRLNVRRPNRNLPWLGGARSGSSFGAATSS